MDRVLAAVGVPLVVYGPGTADKDNEVLVAVAVRLGATRLIDNVVVVVPTGS